MEHYELFIIIMLNICRYATMKTVKRRWIKEVPINILKVNVKAVAVPQS